MIIIKKIFRYHKNKIMRWLCFIVCILFALKGFNQCKNYSLDAKRDTINCIDQQDQKQGKWIVHTEKLRGEPGFVEQGFYKDDKKEGAWAKFNLVGDALALENYKWGYKNGTCEYYNLAGLERKESWKATDPKNPYDTIDVYDLQNPDKITQKVVKVDASTVKHGIWEYYNSSSGNIVKTEEFELDALVDPRKKKPLTTNPNSSLDSTLVAEIDSVKTDKTKPSEVLQYEKKNSNKKKIKVREGHTGIN